MSAKRGRSALAAAVTAISPVAPQAGKVARTGASPARAPSSRRAILPAVVSDIRTGSTSAVSSAAVAAPSSAGHAAGGAGVSGGGGGSRRSVAVPHPEWRAHLANVRDMRSARDAAVDTMGCERCADSTAPPAVQRYQNLVSLMLSSQTKDPVTYAATQRLIAHGLTPHSIVATPEAKVAELIFGVGFWRNKARFIRAASQLMLDKHGGDIPRTLEGLLELPGVGPKMAYIAMSSLWGDNVGIGVDTHVHRIANRLAWVKTTTPEATRAALQDLLPREEWADLNVLFVGFGQQTCTPLAPRCGDCKNKSICPVGAGLASPSVTPKRKVPDW